MINNLFLKLRLFLALSALPAGKNYFSIVKEAGWASIADPCLFIVYSDLI
jgi:hypothetical protein